VLTTRTATGFYRAVHPLLAVVSAVEQSASPELRPYLRDVHDHLVRVDEGIGDQRELLRQVLDANMAVTSVEQTRVGVQQNRTTYPPPVAAGELDLHFMPPGPAIRPCYPHRPTNSAGRQNEAIWTRRPDQPGG
jgi:hypothetical protein